MQDTYLLLNEGYDDNIYIESSYGSYIYIDKKKYVDLSSCAGSQILGYSNNKVNKIYREIIKKKISNCALPNVYAKEFAYTLNKILKNFSKYIFCNSGSEAIVKGLRIARSINNKKLIINTTGSWHGSVNETLYAAKKNLALKKLSDGLPKFNEKYLKFIPYGNILISKKILDKYKKNINCILLEPIQGSLPTDNNVNYIRFLESYCKKNNIIFFLDEMITGLRIDGSSFQNYFNVKSDISIFGKSFGGGFPLGIVAINKKLDNKIKKKKLKVYFGGTFSGNSINMYIGNKITKIINENKQIIENINKKTNFFKNSINNFAIKNNLDIRVYNFMSMARIIFSRKKISDRVQRDFFESKKIKKIEYFKKYLFKKKIYYPKNGILFLSYSLKHKDLNYTIQTIKKALNLFFK